MQFPQGIYDNETVPDRAGTCYPRDLLSSLTSGIQDQLGKVPFLPITTNAIRPELPHTDKLTSQGKDGAKDGENHSVKRLVLVAA